jgi:predicted ABC-type ATPase
MSSSPRLRMFAGPNGSGKSTLKEVLAAELLGVYLNPDEIESTLRTRGSLDVRDYGVDVFPAIDSHARDFFKSSTLLRKEGLLANVPLLMFSSGVIDFSRVSVNSYHASVLADFLRQRLLDQRASFTLETVMSSPTKVDLLARAQSLGYRTYLYFVATADPEINISRVEMRVRKGGHGVPRDKIEQRYHRSIGFLREALRHTNRAYIFDNSGHDTARVWLAEITDGRTIEIKVSEIPEWFSAAILRAAIPATPDEQ